VSLRNIGGLNLTGLTAAGSGTLAAESINGAGNVSTGTGFTVTVASDSLLSGVISGAGALNKQGGGTLTVSGNNTYAGDTNVLTGTLALGGSDRANTGVVNISSGATYRGSAGSFTNSGIIAGNGTLDVAATSFTNAGTLRPGGTGAIGTLTVAGNATLASSSLIDIEAQSAASHDVLAVTGAAALNGNLNVTPINGYAPANGDVLTPLTYANRSGTVFVPGTWLPTYNPSSLSLGFDSNINRWVGTTGNWNLAANWSRGHTPLASETVLVDVPGAQLVSVSDGSRFAGKLVSFEDFALSGGSLSLGGPSFFNGGLTLSGGTLQGAGNVLATSAFTWTGGTLGGTGQFTTAPGSIVTLSPTATSLQLQRNWVNQGFVTWQGANGSDLVIADGKSLVNMLGGMVTLAAAQGGNIKGDGAFRNDGTMNMNGAERTTIKTAFVNGTTGTLNVNSGTLRLKDSASNEGAIGIASGSTLEVKGGDYVNRGRISGSGTLDVDGHLFTNVGVLAPGGSNGLGLGTFTVRGDYYQAASGVLEMGLGGVLAGQYDVLAVTGKASLGGTLATNAVNGYLPSLGDSFNLLTYKSRTGQFTTLEAPAPLGLAADYEKRFARFTLD
jgi:autotransporter-associated beta strand protein